MQVPPLDELCHDSQCGKTLSYVPYVLDGRIKSFKALSQCGSKTLHLCRITLTVLLLTSAPSPGTNPFHPTLGLLVI